jgi:hypothetical protein
MAEPKLPSPKLDTLRACIKRIDEIIDSGADVVCMNVDPTFKNTVEEEFLVDMRDILFWTYQLLQNRRDYHRQRNAKTKAELELLEEALTKRGINVNEIKRRAHGLAADSIQDTEDDLDSRLEGTEAPDVKGE